MGQKGWDSRQKNAEDSVGTHSIYANAEKTTRYYDNKTLNQSGMYLKSFKLHNYGATISPGCYNVCNNPGCVEWESMCGDM